MRIKQIIAFGFMGLAAAASFMYAIAPVTDGLIIVATGLTLGTLVTIADTLDEQIYMTRMHITATTIATAVQIDPTVKKELKKDVNKLFKKLRAM